MGQGIGSALREGGREEYGGTGAFGADVVGHGGRGLNWRILQIMEWIGKIVLKIG